MQSTKKPSKSYRKKQSPDVHQEITDQIIKMLEDGVSPWRCPWDKSGLASMPLRATGESYRGMNVFLLWARAERMGYQSSHWLTFKQAKDLGAHVRKGEKSTAIYFNKPMEKETSTIDESTGEAIRERYWIARQYRVFNADQIDGLPEKYQPVEFEGTEIERIEKADALVAATGARIKHEGGRACYQPIADEITMPASERFEDGEAYYPVLTR